jgi:hypothetical protein
LRRSPKVFTGVAEVDMILYFIKRDNEKKERKKKKKLKKKKNEIKKVGKKVFFYVYGTNFQKLTLSDWFMLRFL